MGTLSNPSTSHEHQPFRPQQAPPNIKAYPLNLNQPPQPISATATTTLGNVSAPDATSNTHASSVTTQAIPVSNATQQQLPLFIPNLY